MNRGRFLLVAATASAAASAATFVPRGVLAATAGVARVHVVRWPKEMLYGIPGRCAGTRRGGGFDVERMLSLR